MKCTEKKKLFLFVLISSAVVLIDQLLKYFIAANMQPAESAAVINNIFHITYVQNTGAVFSLFKDSTTLLIWISVVVIGAVIYYYDKIPDKKYAVVSAALFLGGTIGNLIDRVRLGYVVDFLDFRIWPVFNIADSAITIGVLMMVVYLIREKPD